MTLPARLAALALTLLPLHAAAQYGGPASGRPAEEAPPPPSGPPALQVLLQMAFDRGSNEIVQVVYDDGSKESIYFNSGFNFSVGALFLPLLGGRLQTQAAIGVQGWNITAPNAVTGEDEDIRWFAVPIEVMEFVNAGFVRVGAGLSYLVNPSVKGKGSILGDPLLQYEFSNSPGLVVEADWTGANTMHPRHPRYWLGLRYRMHTLVDQYDAKIEGNSFGLVMGLAY